jgi:hypothetical protein
VFGCDYVCGHLNKNGMKKYKFIGNQEEAEQYGNQPPVFGQVYSGNVHFGKNVGNEYNIDECANNTEYGREWEEVIDPFEVYLEELSADLIESFSSDLVKSILGAYKLYKNV